MIESAQYTVDEHGYNSGIAVIIGGVTKFVPLDYSGWVGRMLQEWVAAGNVIAPAATIPAN